jgi:hypothetical protein
MENLKKQNLTNEQKMEILQGFHMIIWDANNLLGKLAISDSEYFDYNEFKHDFYRLCKYICNDTQALMKMKL